MCLLMLHFFLIDDCCGCFCLRSAVIVLAIIEIILFILGLLIGASSVHYVFKSIENFENETYALYLLYGILFILLIIYILLLIGAIQVNSFIMSCN